MNLVRTYSAEIAVNEPITLEAIYKAIYKFRSEVADYPEEIEISPYAKEELLTHTNSIFSATPDSIMGLKIKINPELPDNEWRVIKKISNTYVTKDEK